MILPNISPSEWRWPHFSWAEMSCRGSGECCMSPDFLDVLEAIREEFGRPMPVTSGYRSPEYNASVSHTGRTGPHTTGMAADIAVAGENAYRLIKVALAYGITGIGVSQKGPKKFLHLDMANELPRPTIWSY